MNRVALLGPVLALLALAGCSQPTATATDASASGGSVPGATGRTVVPGSNSTVAGDANATEQQQKWPLGGRR